MSTVWQKHHPMRAKQAARAVVRRILGTAGLVRRLGQGVGAAPSAEGVASARLPDGQCVLLRWPGPQEEVATSLQHHGFRGYEPETVALFYDLCRHTTCVCDVGAYSGYFALVAAKANPAARVFAFEPAPWAYDALVGNIGLNGSRNVRAERLAVSDRDGETNLFMPAGTLPTGASTLAGFRPARSTLLVRTVTLDAYVAQHDTGHVDLVKIDTESTEHEVLAGMQQIMDRDAPVIIAEVLAGRNEAAQQSILAAHGYRWFWLTNSGPVAVDQIVGDTTYRFRNYLYAHPRRQDLGRLLPAQARTTVGI